MGSGQMSTASKQARTPASLAAYLKCLEGQGGYQVVRNPESKSIQWVHN